MREWTIAAGPPVGSASALDLDYGLSRPRSRRCGSTESAGRARLVITNAADRKDLTDRLGNTQRRLADPSVRVLVVGEFKQGKSLLVNALLNVNVCPVDDDVATSVPTVLRHGAEMSAELVFGAPRRWGGRRRHHPPDDRARTASGAGRRAREVRRRGRQPGQRAQAVHAEVTLPRRFLAGGLVVVDTPGVGGIGSAHSAATLAALPTADAVLLVSDAAQEYSEPEMDFLRQAMKLCPNVACVLTKTDLYPQWRRVAELDRKHLKAAGIDVPLMPVSSTLRIHALNTKDADLNVESGFRALSDFLQTNILGRISDLARTSVVNDVQYVSEHLALSVQGEIATLRDPAHNQEFVAELEKARENANALRRRSAKWQNVLNDGITDLIADIEYDFRDRIRIITREAEQIIDAADPGEIWDQFSEWFSQRTAAAVGDNFVWAHERSEWLAGQVAECFAEGGVTGLPRVSVSDTAGVLDPVPELLAVPGPGPDRREDPDRHAWVLRRRPDVRPAHRCDGNGAAEPDIAGRRDVAGRQGLPRRQEEPGLSAAERSQDNCPPADRRGRPARRQAGQGPPPNRPADPT